MSGEEVKKLLQKRGYTLKDVAEWMGETPQNFQAMLKVADIKTGVLERICKAIQHDIFFFFDLNDDIPGYKRPENPIEDLGQALFRAAMFEQLATQKDENLKDKEKLISAYEDQIFAQNKEIDSCRNEIGLYKNEISRYKTEIEQYKKKDFWKKNDDAGNIENRLSALEKNNDSAVSSVPISNSATAGGNGK